MKRTHTALFVAGMLAIPTANAIEIYNDQTNSVTVGGFIDARVINTQAKLR